MHDSVIWQFLRVLLLIGAVAAVMNLFFKSEDTSKHRRRERDSD
jgi:hypothetical protein